jgi:hypothetical protein
MTVFLRYLFLAIGYIFSFRTKEVNPTWVGRINATECKKGSADIYKSGLLLGE